MRHNLIRATAAAAAVLAFTWVGLDAQGRGRDDARAHNVGHNGLISTDGFFGTRIPHVGGAERYN